MEKNLKILLTDIIKKQDTIKNMELILNENKKRQNDAVEKFEKEFKQDVESGIYPNMTDGQIARNINEGKESINRRYQVEQEELENKISELNEQEENEKDSQYNDIMTALSEYKDEMLKEQGDLENQVDNLEKQKNAELDTLSKEIQLEEAKLSHLMVQNRDTMDMYNENTLEIMQLSDRIKELKEQAKSVDIKYNSQIVDLQKQLETFNTKISTVDQFFGKIDLKSKSPKEIYEIVFGDEQVLEEQEQEQEDEIVIEEIEEQPEIEELVIEHPETKVMEEEQPKVDTVVMPKPQPKVEPVIKPEVQPKVEPVIKPEVQPKVEPVIKPEAQPKVEPVVKPKPQPKVEPVIKPEAQPKVEPVTKPEARPEVKNNTRPKTEVVKEPEKKKDEKFSYEFSADGIKYDGKNIDPTKLIKVYNNPENQEKIDKAIFDLLGKNTNVIDFIDFSDRFAYLSIILSDSKKDKNTGEIIMGDTAKKRLKEYYDVWSNPKEQDDSNMSISYDFKNLSSFSKFFKSLDRKYADEILNIKDNAVRQRNRKNVTVKNAGVINTVRFKISKFINNAKNGFKKFFILPLASGYEYDDYEDAEYEEVGREEENSKEPSKSFRQKVKEQAGQIKSKMTYEPKYASKTKTKSKDRSKEDDDLELF